ncbi:MAG: branched-chain amino acid ABC transporter substrate-binding protein [bacterium]|nr:branched-chain amino acid ABC transporter substrate-binding protein [bacterium]MXV90487.1 ABC transporter substrate-binding protein [Acidimicrobiia bacterium]MYC44683.1 ABC transporter substrate-binding protein [Acidimicrobiia bacterium]MYI19208.1 ABC transporter substrate-binding protein [Acidimicrobiia bacterium]
MVSWTGRPLRRAGRLGVLSTAVIAIVLSAAVACGDDEPDALGDESLGVVRVAAGEHIPIRLVLALTASGSSGVASENTARLAVADFGPIRGFDVDIGGAVDEFCDPQGGLEAAASVVAEGNVVGVVGTTCSAAAVTAAPVLTGAGLVMVSPSNTSPLLTSDLAGNPSVNQNDGYYRTAGNDLHQGAALARFLDGERGIGHVAVIHNGDAYTQSLAEALVGAFEASGGTITATMVVARDESDMVPALTEIAAGAPEALFLSVSGPVAATAVQQIGGVAGLENVLLIGADGLLSDMFLGVPESEGMFFSSPDVRFGDNANQSSGRSAADLLATYEQSYGGPPEAAYWGHAYDATMLLLEAIRAASRLDGDTLVIDRAGVREYLDGVAGYAGIIGSITCDRWGDCGTQSVVIIEHLDADDIATTRTNVVYEYRP